MKVIYRADLHDGLRTEDSRVRGSDGPVEALKVGNNGLECASSAARLCKLHILPFGPTPMFGHPSTPRYAERFRNRFCDILS